MLGDVFTSHYIFQTVLTTSLIKFRQRHCRTLESQIITSIWSNQSKKTISQYFLGLWGKKRIHLMVGSNLRHVPGA